MDITVILCTFNRSASLKAALDSLVRQILPSSVRWELLVIDNNSTDATRAVIEDYGFRHPGLVRYVFEARQGKSNALNRGIQEAKGDVLAFVDDDVTADPDWLKNLVVPLRDSTWAGVGGRIVPPVNFSPPRWLALEGPYSLAGVLALYDKGSEGIELREPPFGTNMAFRKCVFDKHGLFHPDIGPRPGSEIRGEDTEFGRRVLAAGERLWYAPGAVIHHPVPGSRLRKDYFLRFLYDQGRAAIREGGFSAHVWGIPRLYLTLPKIVLGVLVRRTLSWTVTANPLRRFQRKTMVWMTLGQITEIVRFIARRPENV
jgi:glycosyltransferase involved in cell wall biosynthesis